MITPDFNLNDLQTIIQDHREEIDSAKEKYKPKDEDGNAIEITDESWIAMLIRDCVKINNRFLAQAQIQAINQRINEDANNF